LLEHDHIQELRRKELNAKIDEGLASAARGELTPADKVFEKLKAERRKKKAA
jgi:predicted transcriptional regulator